MLVRFMVLGFGWRVYQCACSTRKRMRSNELSSSSGQLSTKRAASSSSRSALGTFAACRSSRDAAGGAAAAVAGGAGGADPDLAAVFLATAGPGGGTFLPLPLPPCTVEGVRIWVQCFYRVLSLGNRVWGLRTQGGEEKVGGGGRDLGRLELRRLDMGRLGRRWPRLMQ